MPRGREEGITSSYGIYSIEFARIASKCVIGELCMYQIVGDANAGQLTNQSNKGESFWDDNGWWRVYHHYYYWTKSTTRYRRTSKFPEWLPFR